MNPPLMVEHLRGAFTVLLIGLPAILLITAMALDVDDLRNDRWARRMFTGIVVGFLLIVVIGTYIGYHLAWVDYHRMVPR